MMTKDKVMSGVKRGAVVKLIIPFERGVKRLGKKAERGQRVAQIALPEKGLASFHEMLGTWKPIIHILPLDDGDYGIARLRGNPAEWKPAVVTIVCRLGGSVRFVMKKEGDPSLFPGIPSTEIIPGVRVVSSFLKRRADKATIVLKPSMVFGVGTHPTTRICARAMRESLAESRARSFLDVGCGSGILCAVAARLGIAVITACDWGRHARQVARENFKLNRMKGRVLSKIPDRRFDLIVANLCLSTLMKLRWSISRATAPGGRVILSGIEEKQTNSLIKAYRGFEPKVRYDCEGWAAVLLERR